MKKLLIAVFCLNGILAFAQLSVKKLDGTVINDGDVFVYNTLSNPDDLENPNNYLGLKIYNTSAQSIHVKAEVVSISNSTGDNLQLCIGDVCLSAITAGSSYPNSATTIAGNGQNSDFDHLLNGNAGIDTNLPVEYVVKIYMLSGNTPVGNSVTFTYRYQSTLATTGFGSLASAGIVIKSNLVGNQLEVQTQKDVTVTIYDLNGKLVNSTKLVSGTQSIDVSSLNAGMYIANFKNEAGQQATVKIIKK
ncbi:MAG TPA: T9SS type A sorting domain-containing protein [Flavobacterium sp.]|nr:T9SS type A sorting domain-containing protein [Flavobacterium sp.]